MSHFGRILWFGVSIFLVAGALTAQAPSTKRSATVGKSKSCSQTANTQMELDECAGKELKEAEARLTALLKRLAIDSDRPEQKAWEAYRDAQLKAIYPPVSDPRGEYGSVYPMCSANMKKALIESRIRDLEALSKSEGDACQGYHAGGSAE